MHVPHTFVGCLTQRKKFQTFVLTKLLHSFYTVFRSPHGVNRLQASYSLVKMESERAISSSSRELRLENMKKEQQQAVKAICLDSRDVLLLLLVMQKLVIVLVTTLEPR